MAMAKEEVHMPFHVVCHKCGKKGPIQRDCKSKGDGSSGNQSEKYTNDLTDWVIKKSIISYNKYLETFTMTQNSKNYKTGRSPRCPLFPHTLSFECTINLQVNFLTN